MYKSNRSNSKKKQEYSAQVVGHDAETDKRSIIVSGIGRDTPLNKILKFFQQYEYSGGGEIQNFDLHANDKIKITYWHKRDAERVLDRGPIFKYGNYVLKVHRFDNDDYMREDKYFSKTIENDFSNGTSSLKEDAPEVIREPTPVVEPIKVDIEPDRILDTKRIILCNVPNALSNDHLELYLEYLSDEIGVERYDFSKENKNVAVVTFQEPIDFLKMQEKHLQRPKFNKNLTELWPVYVPDTVLVELEDANAKSQNLADKVMHKDILELYFSNKKRSNGGEIKKVETNLKNAYAMVTFKSIEVARKVSLKTHQINQVKLQVRLYYDKIGSDPYFNSLDLLREQQANFNSISTTTVIPQQQQLLPPMPSQISSNFTKADALKLENEINAIRLEKSFDPRFLSPQQTNYLAQLQTIYNELNNSNLNLFKIPLDDLSINQEHQPVQPAQPPILNQTNFQTRVLMRPPNPTVLPVNQTKINESYNNMLEYEGDVKSKMGPEPLGRAKTDLPAKPLELVNVDNSKKIIGANTAYYQITDSSSSSETSESRSGSGASSQSNSKDDSKTNSKIENGPRPVVNLPSLDNTLPTLNDYKLFDAFKINFKTNSAINTPTNLFLNNNELNSSLTKDESNINIPMHRVINLASARKPRMNHAAGREKPPPPKLFKHNFGKQELIKQGEKIQYYQNQIIPSGKSKEKMPIVDSAELKRDIQAQQSSNDEPLFLKNKPDKQVQLSLPHEEKQQEKENAKLTKNNASSSVSTTKSDAINKLEPIHVEFLQSTKYVNFVQSQFPKLSINYNEKLKQIYLFGNARQIDEAKLKIKKDLDAIKLYKYELEKSELARFLKKLEVKQKITKFIESLTNRNLYAKSSGDKELTFFKYDIELYTSKSGEAKNGINITTNNPQVNDLFKKFIQESIKVNSAIFVGKKIAENIKYNDSVWANLYDKVKSNIDFVLVRDNKSTSSDQWVLKLTGFNEEIESFIQEFNSKLNKN